MDTAVSFFSPSHKSKLVNSISTHICTLSLSRDGPTYIGFRSKDSPLKVVLTPATPTTIFHYLLIINFIWNYQIHMFIIVIPNIFNWMIKIKNQQSNTPFNMFYNTKQTINNNTFFNSRINILRKEANATDLFSLAIYQIFIYFCKIHHTSTSQLFFEIHLDWYYSRYCGVSSFLNPCRHLPYCPPRILVASDHGIAPL